MNTDWAPGGRQPSDQTNRFGLWVCRKIGCYHPQTPSPCIIITQLVTWYLFYRPTEGGRLSRPRHCSKDAQPVPKAVYRSLYLRENCQRISCKAFIGLTNRAKMIGGGRPLLPEILDQTAWPCWREIIDFRSLFARSASAVTPSEKVQLTLIESPLRAFQWS